MPALKLGPLGDWLLPAAAVLVAAIGALLVFYVARPIVVRLVRHAPVARVVVKQLDRPLKWLLPLVAAQLMLQGVPDETLGIDPVRHFVGILVIAAFTAVAIAAVRGVEHALEVMHPQDVSDNLAARRILTQTRVLARIAIGLILFAGLAFILMTFPTARQLGTSLLASAGLSALVLGIAARSVFGNLLAGLQIALTQPIRIDDVLIVQGEWGRVEEITSTYIVMKIWDERRLVIPLQWFIDNPFQNWTRTSAQIIGSVFFWVDYMTDLEPLRAEATRLAQSSKDFDGRVCLLQVTDTSERSMQLRLIVSSPSAGQNWDLRCLLREGLIAFMRREQPHALPRLRAEIESVPRADRERADEAEAAAATGKVPTLPQAAAPAPSAHLEARLAGARVDAGNATVNNDTGMASLTAPTRNVVMPKDARR
jgi:small-conductance mechanosensitive channel